MAGDRPSSFTSADPGKDSGPWEATEDGGEGRHVIRFVLYSSFSGCVHSWLEALSPMKGDGGLDEGY